MTIEDIKENIFSNNQKLDSNDYQEIRDLPNGAELTSEYSKAFIQPLWVLGIIDNHVKAIEELENAITYNEIPRLIDIKNTLADIKRELLDKEI